MILQIDGVKTKLTPLDLDGDGVTGGIENLNPKNTSNFITPLISKSETGEIVSEINRDIVNEEGMSSIDFKARLTEMEVSVMVALDSLIGLRFLEEDNNLINRGKMRKSVSLEGKGRSDIVDISGGKMNREAPNITLGDRIKNAFKRGDKGEIESKNGNKR